MLKRSTLHRLINQVGRATLIDDGILELTASSRYSPQITLRLVVSYITFSPLPSIMRLAVIFFYLNLLLPIACIFASGVLYAARTFLSQDIMDKYILPAIELKHCCPVIFFLCLSVSFVRSLSSSQICDIISTLRWHHL